MCEGPGHSGRTRSSTDLCRDLGISPGPALGEPLRCHRLSPGQPCNGNNKQDMNNLSSLGYKTRATLKPDAVPTVFKRKKPSEASPTPARTDRRTLLTHKLEHRRSNEVTSSVAMEKEGLLRALDQLNRNDVVIKELVTDRHLSIRKMMRETKPDIKHSVDVWHLDKGLGKKLLAVSKERDRGLVSEWKQSISKHIY
uniref:Uncharacterized protein n=1 Tax=Knipowitschia caucasica TaxID=637954 RepID=A0AAV2KKW4_KNICA